MSAQAIWAVIRRERKVEVLKALESAGVFAITEMPVYGRGKQRGIQVGAVTYEELAKTLLFLVVPEEHRPTVVDAIIASAHTGQPGDGKIFVQAVREVHTVRTGNPEL